MTKLIVSLAVVGSLLGGGSWATAASPAAPEPAATKEPMRVIRVLLKVKPDQEEAFVSFVNEEALAVARLDGCVRYQLFKSAGPAEEWLLYEEWATTAAFDAYKQSELFKKSFEVLGPMMAGAPNSAYYDAIAVR